MLFEIIRHLKPGGYDYAWFRTKELFLHTSAYVGSFLILFALVVGVVWILSYGILMLGITLGNITVSNVKPLCNIAGIIIGLPLSIIWFRGLIKQEKEAIETVAKLKGLQHR